MAFPPLVSSTPPPLEEFEEEEDEFGDFASGGMDGLSLSSGSPHKLPTPVKTPIGTPVRVVQEEVNKIQVEVQVNEEAPVRVHRIQVEDVHELSDKDQEWKELHTEATEVPEKDGKEKESDEDDGEMFVEAKDQYIDFYSSDGVEQKEAKNLFVEDKEPSKLDVEDSNEYLEPKEQLYGEDVQQFRQPIDRVDLESTDLYKEYNEEYKEPKDLYEEYQQEFTDSKDFFEECQQEFTESKDFYEEYKPEFKEPKDVYEEYKPEYKESEDLYEEQKQEYTKPIAYNHPIQDSSISEVNKDSSSIPAVQSTRTMLDDVEEDDFGDFEDFQASFPPAEPQAVWATPETSSQEEFHCPEDFGDFESNVDFLGSIKRIENEDASNKIEDILRTMFPQSAPADDGLEINVGSLIGNSDKLWVRIKNVEESHALNFHWSNSSSNNVLLEALGIDSRNILFGPRWNPNVPRFAANLGFAPLEPTKAPEKAVFEPEKSTEEVPAAQFDWNSSGLVNPLEASGGMSALLPLDLLFDPLLTPDAPASRRKARNPHVEEREEKRKKQEARRRETASRRKAGKENSGTVVDRHGRQMPVQPETVKVLRKLPDLSFLSARSLMLDRSMLESQLAG